MGGLVVLFTMRFISRTLCAVAVSSTLLLAADPAPLADLRVADGKNLIAHWQKTPIGRTWADPALAPLHAKWAEAEAKVQETTGATLTAWLEATSQTQALITESPTAIPGFRVSSDLGALAAGVIPRLSKDAATSKPVTVVGADEAITDPEARVTLARLGTALVAFGGGLGVIPAKPSPVEADLLGVLHVESAIRWVESLPVEDQEARRAISQMVVAYKAAKVREVDYRLSLVPEGVLEVMTSDGVMTPGYLPVDQALVARLQATTVSAMAMGFDMSVAWKEQRATALAQWAPMLGRDPKDPDAVEAEINRVMATMGLPVTVAQLAETKGTLVVALSPGMPVPGLTIWLPRSAGVDQVMATAATKMQVTLPAEGSSTPVLMPGLPLPLTMARDAGHWALTTDPQQNDAFLAAKPGGWSDTPAWKLAVQRAPAGAPVMAASDTPAFLRMVSGLAGMALGMQKQGDPALRQAILQGLTRLGREASTGYLVAGVRDGRQIVEARSVTGMVSLPMIAGGIAFMAADAKAKARAGKKSAPEPGPKQDAPGF